LTQQWHKEPHHQFLTSEPYIVETIAQLARMRSPINVKTGLQLANSIIEGTPLMLELIAWKTKHNIHSCRRCYSSSAVGKEAHQQEGQLEGTTTTAEQGHLGWGYWKGFMKRNGHLIKSKKAVKFDSKRADWCTYQNFETMYKEVYNEMVKGGIEVKLPSKCFSKQKRRSSPGGKGLIWFPNKIYSFSIQINCCLSTRLNLYTSTSKDGNVGGEKFLWEAMLRPHIVGLAIAKATLGNLDFSNNQRKD
jgi:hypothetical protein